MLPISRPHKSQNAVVVIVISLEHILFTVGEQIPGWLYKNIVTL